MIALEHINFRGDGCCAYHIGCANLALILQEMCSSECMPDLAPATGWQCGSCFSLNGIASCEGAPDASSATEALMECEICGKYATPAPLPTLQVREVASCSSLPSASSTHRSHPECVLQDCTSTAPASIRSLHQPTPQQCVVQPLLCQLEQAAACQMPSSSDSKDDKALMQMAAMLPVAMGGSTCVTASTELPIGSAVPSLSNTARSVTTLGSSVSDSNGEC